jgi:hypothetical protein
MELGQEGWLKQPEAKVRGPNVPGDQGSGIMSGSPMQRDSTNRRIPVQEVWVHPRDANCCPPRREANSWPTGPVRLCSGVRMQEIHKTELTLNLPAAHTDTFPPASWSDLAHTYPFLGLPPIHPYAPSPLRKGQGLIGIAAHTLACLARSTTECTLTLRLAWSTMGLFLFVFLLVAWGGGDGRLDPTHITCFSLEYVPTSLGQIWLTVLDIESEIDF